MGKKFSFTKLFISICFISLFLIIVIYKLGYIINTTNIASIDDTPKQWQRVYTKKQKFNAPVFDAQTWIINAPIAQYSSKIIVRSESNQLILETLVFYDDYDQNQEWIKSNTKFMLFKNQDSNATYIKVIEMRSIIGNQFNGSTRIFWRFRAYLNMTDYNQDVNKIHFAVINYKKIEERLKKYETHEDLKYLISFHKPKIYDPQKIFLKEGKS